MSDYPKRIAFALLLAVCTAAVRPSELDCDPKAVEVHVRDQFAIYGPQSAEREYFGFIYRLDGRVHSAIVRGRRCPNPIACAIDTAIAAREIPKGAKVLGEWHTHPHVVGSGVLSAEDVFGAHANRRIRCYQPFYGTSDGKVYAWDPVKDSVPTAMASRVFLGNYRAADTISPVPGGHDRHALLRIRMPELQLPRLDPERSATSRHEVSELREEGVGLYETDCKSDKENKRNLAGDDKEEVKRETKTDIKAAAKACEA